MNTKTHTSNSSTIKELCEAYGLKPPTHPSRNKLWGEIKLPEDYKKPKRNRSKHKKENIINTKTSNNQYLNIKEMCEAYGIKPPTHPSRNKLWGEIKLPENYKKPKINKSKHIKKA